MLRFGSFYGADAFQTVDMIGWVKRGLAPLPGKASAYISAVSHDDAATAVASAVTLPSGVYNVVDDEPVTHREFFDSLAQALGVASPTLPPSWATPLFGSLGSILARSTRDLQSEAPFGVRLGAEVRERAGGLAGRDREAGDRRTDGRQGDTGPPGAPRALGGGTMNTRLDYGVVAPGTYKALGALEHYLRGSGLEPSLVHLVKLRASQINGCAYCTGRTCGR